MPGCQQSKHVPYALEDTVKTPRILSFGDTTAPNTSDHVRDVLVHPILLCTRGSQAQRFLRLH